MASILSKPAATKNELNANLRPQSLFSNLSSDLWKSLRSRALSQDKPSINPEVRSILTRTTQFLAGIEQQQSLPQDKINTANELKKMIGDVLGKYSTNAALVTGQEAAAPSASDSANNENTAEMMAFSNDTNHIQTSQTPPQPDEDVKMRPARPLLLKKRAATPEQISASEETAQYVCRECGDVFEHGQALGGHMSRKHPGQSLAFNKKVQRRKEREFERELL